MTTPTRTEWGRISERFHRAIELPEDERERFLAATSAEDAALGAAVRKLVESHEGAGAFMADPPAAPRDLTLGQYQIRGVLGTGGMGVVYLAEDTRLGRAVALKALAPQLTGDPAWRERLRREARAVAALSHPGIATVYALEEIDGQLYIASEHLPGETLRDALARGAWPPDQVMAAARALVQALTAAHDRGIVHRDLKPENIIVTPAGALKILDFGIARVDGAGATTLGGDGHALGTPGYMSPEQIRGDRVDARSDQFALGIVLYELASGVHPFASGDSAGTMARILEREPIPLAERPGLAAATTLNRVVSRCLQKDPAHRHPSTRDLETDLDGAGVPAALDRATTPTTAGARWWWQFHEGAASLLYVALLIPLWLACRPSRVTGATLTLVTGTLAASVGATLRLHLWFAVRAYPAEWRVQHRSSTRWIAGADVLFALTLATAAAFTLDLQAGLAMLLIAASAIVLVSSVIIEPATTRAAFESRDATGERRHG